MIQPVVQGVGSTLDDFYSRDELLFAGAYEEVSVIGVLVVLCAEALSDLRQSCNRV